MLIDIVTIFPETIECSLRTGILERGQQQGLIKMTAHDLRQYTEGRHQVTDEPPYGGGPGMLMKPEPFFRAVEHCSREGTESKVLLVTPQGRQLNHHLCEELAREDHLIILCPRYEGIDERVRQWVVSHEISIGDYVLSGGEFAALVVVDAVARLIPGVVGEPESVRGDSFAGVQLEGPQYTRPRRFRGLDVPEVLLSGNHQLIARWNDEQSRLRTLQRRPDLMEDDDAVYR